MKLPIDVIPGTSPPRFQWEQVVDSLVGRKVIDCQGMVSPGLEIPLKALIALAKLQAQEIEQLQKINQGMADRIAAQSELLSKKAEAPVAPVVAKKK